MCIYKKLVFCTMAILFSSILFGCQSLIGYKTEQALYEEYFTHMAESENLPIGEFADSKITEALDVVESENDTININHSINDAALIDQSNFLFPVAFFINQDDADNVDMSIFVKNPDFTLEENERLIRFALDIALYICGFDVDSFDVDSTVVNEIHYLWGHSKLDLALYIVTDFMMLATRTEVNKIGVPVRIRTWDREEDFNYSSIGAWILLEFTNIEDIYKLTGLSFDA